MNYELNLKHGRHPTPPAEVPGITPTLPEPRSERPRGPRSRRRTIIVVVLIITTAIGAWFFIGGGGEYRAVFLANNQVYFGRFVDIPFWPTITLRDVYYLQVTQPIQGNGSVQPEIKVVKLGNELHGPQDAMVIPKTQIVFWETLKDSSSVLKTIQSMQKK